MERELTDELLVMYFDQAADRLAEQAQSRFDADVEAVRTGTIFAHDNKQYRRWRRVSRSARTQAALVGESLERHIASLAFGRPDLVKREVPA